MEGTTVLHYEIEKLLGRGGMGSVYRARDTRLDTYRALKFLHPGLSDLKFAKDHLLREARTQAKLFHPNVAALLELEIADDHTFLVMEYVDGPSLDVYLKESKPPLDERFRLVLQIAHALDIAHSQDILHRDIKPKNILIASDGTAKVTDFGLAKALGQTSLTMSGETKGTAPYMAPEVYQGETAGKAADVWSLGVLTYEVLEDNLPFKGTTFEAIGHQIINEPHSPISNKVGRILPGISGFVDACLKKTIKERLADGSEAFLSLTGIANGSGLDSSIPVTSIPWIHRHKRRKVLHRTATFVLLGMAIMIGVVLLNPLSITRYEETDDIWPTYNDTAVTWDSTGEHIAFIELDSPVLYLYNTLRPDAEPESFPIDTEAEFKAISWSPDDSAVALSGPDGLYLYNWVDNRLRQISRENTEDIYWSEDGRWIVYSNPEDRGALKRIGPLTQYDDLSDVIMGEALEITGLEFLGRPITLHNPIYILDDTRIAFYINRLAEHLGVFSIPAVGGEAQPLMDGDMCQFSLDWDSKRNELLFYSDQEGSDIYRVKVKRKGRIAGRIRAFGIPLSVSKFDYQPESGKIVALTALVRNQIWKIPISANDDSSKRFITDYDQTFCPSISADGRDLFYVAASSEGGVQIRVHRLTDNLDEKLHDEYSRIKHESYPAPSPDGRYILFQALSDSTQNLWLYDRRRPNFIQLTFDPVPENDPAWAADGESIYYVWIPPRSEGQPEIRQLSLNRIDGRLEPGDYNIIETGGRLRCPFPSPDGSHLLFEDDSTIYVIGPEGAKTELISGSSPALSLSHKDVYYIRDSWIIRIINWSDLRGERPMEQWISPLPENVEVISVGHPLTVGLDAVYIALLEEELGHLRILSPKR